ncbi:MAG: hypothetical protein AAGA75_09225 [Cyanobacteria bacterium P01_E01_bin.6]
MPNIVWGQYYQLTVSTSAQLKTKFTTLRRPLRRRRRVVWVLPFIVTTDLSAIGNE